MIYIHTYIHTYKLTYIRISEIKLVLTQETQAGHVLDRNWSAAKSGDFAAMKLEEITL